MQGNAGDQLQNGYQSKGFRRQAVLITLTYREIDDWRPRHIARCLDHMTRWAARRRFHLGYVWTAELQQRGAVHYHIVCWLPPGLSMPKPDKQQWWRHGMSRIERARRPVGYLVKYASKGNDVQKFPRGLRLHGRGGLELEQRRTVAWWCLPRYVRAVFAEVGTVVRRAHGGGWVSLSSGLWLPPWKPPEVTVTSG